LQFGNTYSEAVVSTSVSEINDKFKGLVVERLQREEDMVHEEVSVDLSNPAK
jgi:hypothetical protein